MLKYDICVDPVEAEKDKTKVVRLALRPYLDGVMVCAVDEDGTIAAAGNLLLFLSDGTLRRIMYVGGFGFQLNDVGRIVEVE